MPAFINEHFRCIVLHSNCHKFRLIRVLFTKMRTQSTLTFMNRNHHFLLLKERVANTLFHYWH